MEDNVVVNAEVAEAKETVEAKPVEEKQEPIEIYWHKDEAVTDIPMADNVKLYGTDEQITDLLAAYTEYLGDVANPVQNKSNPFTKSLYATLDEVLNTVRPALSKHGLGVIQVPVNAEGFVYTQNILFHKGGARMVFPPFGVPVKGGTAQDTIAALTYSRRGSLNPVCGTHGEADDDGNQASGKGSEEKKQKVTPELKAARTELLEAMQAALEVAGKDAMYAVVEKVTGAKNPNAINEVDVCKKAIKELAKLNKEDK